MNIESAKPRISLIKAAKEAIEILDDEERELLFASLTQHCCEVSITELAEHKYGNLASTGNSQNG